MAEWHRQQKTIRRLGEMHVSENKKPVDMMSTGSTAGANA
jgi:hypothetical protein